MHKSAQLGYQSFRIFNDSFFLTAGGLTRGKRDEMVHKLFGRDAESSTDGEKSADFIKKLLQSVLLLHRYRQCFACTVLEQHGFLDNGI